MAVCSVCTCVCRKGSAAFVTKWGRTRTVGSGFHGQSAYPPTLSRASHARGHAPELALIARRSRPRPIALRPSAYSGERVYSRPAGPRLRRVAAFRACERGEMVLGRRIRLLVVLAVVVLLPVLSLAYTYRTYRPAAVRARRVAEVVVSGGGGSRAAAGEQAQAQAIWAISATASAASAAPPPDADSPAQLRIMAAKTAVENALSQRKNRSVVFSKVRSPGPSPRHLPRP